MKFSNQEPADFAYQAAGRSGIRVPGPRSRRGAGPCEVVVVHAGDDSPEAEGVPDSICRRFPPQAEGWPVVLADDWCGEHEPIEGDL